MRTVSHNQSGWSRYETQYVRCTSEARKRLKPRATQAHKGKVSQTAVSRRRHRPPHIMTDFGVCGLSKHSLENVRSCTCNERIIAEPEPSVVYPSASIREGGRHGTRPVFARTPAPRTALPLPAPVSGVARGTLRATPDDVHARQADHDPFPRP